MSRSGLFETEQRGDVCIATLRSTGDGNPEASEALYSELADRLASVGPRKLLINLDTSLGVGHSCYLLSAMFKTELLRVRQAVKASGSELRICGMYKIVRDDFRRANLDGTLLAIYDSVEEALVNF